MGKYPRHNQKEVFIYFIVHYIYLLTTMPTKPIEKDDNTEEVKKRRRRRCGGTECLRSGKCAASATTITKWKEMKKKNIFTHIAKYTKSEKKGDEPFSLETKPMDSHESSSCSTIQMLSKMSVEESEREREISRKRGSSIHIVPTSTQTAFDIFNFVSI